MEHHGPVFCSIFTDVGCIEPLREDEVDLQRAALP